MRKCALQCDSLAHVLLAAVLVGAFATVWYLVDAHFLTPASIAHNLRRQGLYVLPYQPFAGNAVEIRRSQERARLSPLPSPSSHHLLVSHIQPFMTKALDESHGRSFVFWWGSRPRFVVTNPEDVKQILSVDFKNYSKADTLLKVAHRLFGNGLLLAEGEDWHIQRNIIRHAFFPEKLKMMVGDMHFSAMEMTKAWTQVIESSGGKSGEVEVAHHIKNATADILARTCFGSDYEAGKGVFEKQDLLVPIILKHALENLMIPGYRYLPLPSNIESWKLERSIEKQLSDIVKRRLESIAKGGEALLHKTDLLGLMLAGEEGAGLTARQVMDECKTFFFAGHETTANLLAWTMMLLSIHPEWQEKLRTEVVEICGSGTPEPHAQQLNKMRLMTMVLNESLRLYPPVPEIGTRVSSVTTSNTFKLGQLVLPRGMGFAIPTSYIHRNKEVWGEDADEFQPERFCDGASKACKHPFGFLPFSVGPRVCIGQTFAILEAKVIMVAVLQRFRFRLSPNYIHFPESLITLRPKHGMHLILESL